MFTFYRLVLGIRLTCRMILFIFNFLSCSGSFMTFFFFFQSVNWVLLPSSIFFSLSLDYLNCYIASKPLHDILMTPEIISITGKCNKLHIFFPWRFYLSCISSKAVWTWLWAICSRCSCLSRGIGQDDLQRSFSILTIQWFCDFIFIFLLAL